MAELLIERLGGLGGFGQPGSHVASRGRLRQEELSTADSAAVDRLFATRGKAGKSQKPSAARDGFRYRISRGAENVEVHEEQVPAALSGCVRDELI